MKSGGVRPQVLFPMKVPPLNFTVQLTLAFVRSQRSGARY